MTRTFTYDKKTYTGATRPWFRNHDAHWGRHVDIEMDQASRTSTWYAQKAGDAAAQVEIEAAFRAPWGVEYEATHPTPCYEKDRSYPHGELVNEPEADWMFVGGWSMSGLSSWAKAADATLDDRVLSLDAMAYEANTAEYDETGTEGDMTAADIADSYQIMDEEMMVPTDDAGRIEWIKTNTKADQYEAVMLAAMGKSIRDIATITGKSVGATHEKISRTMARLKSRV